MKNGTFGCKVDLILPMINAHYPAMYVIVNNVNILNCLYITYE